MIHIRAAKAFCVLLAILAVIVLFAWGSEHYPVAADAGLTLATMIALSYIAAVSGAFE